MSRLSRCVAVAVAVSLFAGTVSAHDMWILPPSKAVADGKPLEWTVAVGMDFPKSIHAITPERLTFRAVSPLGTVLTAPALPFETRQLEQQQRTVASFTPNAKGAWVLAVQTQPSLLSMTALKFNDYLLHDGLAHVLKQRLDDGELAKDATERYSKFTKGLVAIDGDSSGTAATLRVGLTLEIVPLVNPLTRRVGDTLPVQVFFRGTPLPKANVCWDEPGNGEDFLGQTWTNEKGIALVPIARSGPVTLRLIHMTRPRHADYEWESFWTSYTWHHPARGQTK